MTKIGVAVIGDVRDINCWSSTPYFFYHSGERTGLFSQPWALDVSRFDRQRKLWNLFQVLTGKGVGGYQYSENFLKRAEGQIPLENYSSTVISFNQVFPRASSVLRSGGKIFYYIDSTLKDIFAEPAYGISIPAQMQERAIAQETDNYRNAEMIVTMGSWTRDSLIRYYGIPESKIRHILPGANIEIPVNWKPMNYRPGAGVERDLVLGFIGKDWKRKGLETLIGIRDLLEAQGLRVIVKVIGNCPPELSNRKGVVHTGFLNKQTATDKFIAEVSSCDIGFLLSNSEALGISVLEFLRLGVPVAGYYHQGMKDTLFEGASIRFQYGESVSNLAARIESVVRNENSFRNMKLTALQLMDTVTWDETISKWSALPGIRKTDV